MRLLAFLFSCLAGIVYYQWAVAPLWTLGSSDSLHPVSIDRSNGQFLVFLKKTTGWYFDTIDTANGLCLKSVKLNIPAETRRVFFPPFDATHSACLQLAALCLMYQSSSKTFTGFGVVIVDVETGNPLNTEPMEVSLLRSSAVHHQAKVIVALYGLVKFLEKADPQPRSIKTEGYALVQFLPDGKLFVVCDDWQVMVVEWDSGKTVAHHKWNERRDHPVSRLFVVKPNEFLLETYVDSPQLRLDLERWCWNGRDGLRVEGTVQLQSAGNERQERVGGKSLDGITRDS